MDYTTATSPRYAADLTSINLMVTFLIGDAPAVPLEGEEPPADTRVEMVLPFTAMSDDPAAHGREIYARAAAGEFGQVAAYEPPPVAVPQKISRFQGRAVLFLKGHLEAVQDYMDLPGTPMLHKLAWIDAQDFERDSVTVVALAGVLSLSTTEVDALFIDGAAIKA